MVSEAVLTVAEVNNRLPLVSLIVRDIVQLHGDVASRRERLGLLRERHPAGGSSVYEDEVQQMEEELTRDELLLETYTDELEQLGGMMTDPVIGVVDFASDLSGDRVNLCWRAGEQEVAFWHSGPCQSSTRIPLGHALRGLDGLEEKSDTQLME